MVLTGRSRPSTSAMPATTATSDAGTRSLTRGQTTSAARHASPTIRALMLSVPMLAVTAASLSMLSMGAVPAGYVRPSRSLSWPITMVTAMPAVNPVVMVWGTKRMSVPRRSAPMMMSSAPAMTVAAMSPSMPSVATMPATMVANAAVGPEIWTGLPPSSAMTKPATMAV